MGERTEFFAHETHEKTRKSEMQGIGPFRVFRVFRGPLDFEDQPQSSGLTLKMTL